MTIVQFITCTLKKARLRAYKVLQFQYNIFLCLIIGEDQCTQLIIVKLKTKCWSISFIVAYIVTYFHFLVYCRYVVIYQHFVRKNHSNSILGPFKTKKNSFFR